MDKFSGLEALKIDIANNFGKDKLNYFDRLEWFNSELAPKIKANSSIQDLMLEAEYAEEPELAFAGLQAYIKYLNQEPSGYMVSFDSTSSGIQIMSALMGDNSGMILTNLTYPEQRFDAYTEIYIIFLDKWNKQYPNQEINISRKNIKSAIMVMMYGGSKSIMGKLNNDKRVFDILMEVCSTTISGAYNLRKALLNCISDTATEYSWFTPDGFNVITPITALYTEQRETSIGTIYVKYKDKGTDKFYKGNVANLIHSLDATLMREVIGRCSYNEDKVRKVLNMIGRVNSPEFAINKVFAQYSEIENNHLELLVQIYKQTGFMSVRFIEYSQSELDIAYLLQELGFDFLINLSSMCLSILQNKSFHVLCVHDCFKCLPNHVNTVRYWYNNVLADIVSSNSLQFMMSFLPNGLKEFNKLPKPNQDLVNKIREANYAIC